MIYRFSKKQWVSKILFFSEIHPAFLITGIVRNSAIKNFSEDSFSLSLSIQIIWIHISFHLKLQHRKNFDFNFCICIISENRNWELNAKTAPLKNTHSSFKANWTRQRSNENRNLRRIILCSGNFIILSDFDKNESFCLFWVKLFRENVFLARNSSPEFIFFWFESVNFCLE